MNTDFKCAKIYICVRLTKYMTQIKNIIFDLGGVIINLDIPKTIGEFNKLCPVPFEEIYTQLQQYPIFDAFDKGNITEDDFFNYLKENTKTKASINQLKMAWDAMLLDFPLYRLQQLLQLKKQYRLFLLSNTNETHINSFEAQLQQTHGYPNLEPFFEKVYYSCRIGKRKPDKEIFEFVLNENQLIPSETVFIDDSPQHVTGASLTGIKGFLLEKNQEFMDLLRTQNIPIKEL